SQVHGLLVGRMMCGTTVSLAEQARPFIVMLTGYLGNTPALAEECFGSSGESEYPKKSEEQLL
ncbi:MAG TPA: hypothetical protein VFN35_36760, partial [Ktedonobacteraceae bacterium]|nr:hypothetical protein [Ktedonobacteraceae bacterium]